jgi:hypothetical protein
VRIVGGNQGFGVTTGPYAQLTQAVWQELRPQQQALDGMFAWGQRDIRVGERANRRPAEGMQSAASISARLAWLRIADAHSAGR